MKSLKLDDLDAVSGGVGIHSLGLAAHGAGDANVPYLNGAGTASGLGGIGGGLGNLGNLLGGAGGALGGLGNLSSLGPMINEVLHSPAVSNIVHTVEQFAPQLTPIINGVEHMIDGQGGAQGFNLGSLLGAFNGAGGQGPTGQGGGFF
jgi:hypothetical protein